MKKLISILLALTLSLGVVLTACDDDPTPPAPSGGQTEKVPDDDPAKEYAVTITCSEGGTYSLTPGPYYGGDEVTLTLLPFSGYAVESVTLNGEKVTLIENNSYTFTVSAETSIYVEYGKISTYTVEVTCGEGGSYTLSPNKSVYYAGDEVTLTVTHRRSYEFGDVTLNGSAVTLSEDGTYSFTIEGNVVIDIAFEEIVTHTLNVSCGSGGTYSLSASGPYSDGQEVTLTVYPNADMNVKSVTVNGETVTLTQNTYILHVTEDMQITIAFEQKSAGTVETYDVFVTCGSEGSYTLSPEGPYTSGTEVTLSVTPQDGYYISSFTVDGTETALTDGKYVFTVTKDVVITVSFSERIFAEDLAGRWSPLSEAGTLGYALTLKGDSVLFSETEDAAQEYPLSDIGNGRYSFTVTDEENTSTVFTFSFLQIANGAKLLVLSHTEEGETVEAYYLLDGIDYYTFEFPEELVGAWRPTVLGSGYAIEFRETEMYYGGAKQIVLAFDATNYTTTILNGTLNYSSDVQQITFVPSDSEADRVYYYKEIPPEPILIPDLAGSWKTFDGEEEHTALVNEEGRFYFDGVEYQIITNDNSGQMKSYSFTKDGKSWGVDFYDYKVWVHESSSVYDDSALSYEMYSSEKRFSVKVVCGEHGSYTITPGEENGLYAYGDVITVTITADEGYEIESLIGTGNEGDSPYSRAPGMKTWTTTFTITEAWLSTSSNGRIFTVVFRPVENA